MKKYITAFFTCLGYTTFIFLIGAATLLYIGHRKSQAAEAAVMSAHDGQVVSLTPAKQADTIATSAQTLPDFQPVSKKPVSASKTKPVRHKAPRKTTPEVSAKPVTPVMHATPKSAQTVQVEKSKTAKQKKARTAPKPAPMREQLPPCTLTYRATDRSASPRTGGSHIPDVYAPPSELEQQAIRHARNIRQLEEETAKLRNPTVEETGLMKLLSGGGDDK